MKNLDKVELMTINGGQVPTGYYMDNDVIGANKKILGVIGSFFAGFLVGFFD
jgi:lactobin A/cerein 7B family class IIb bacteriocin